MGTLDDLFDGSEAHRIDEYAMREQFESWIRRGAPFACFDLGEGGDYIVPFMQDQFEAFCAGALLMGSNAIGEGPGADSCARSLSTDGLEGNGGSGNV